VIDILKNIECQINGIYSVDEIREKVTKMIERQNDIEKVNFYLISSINFSF